jgi:hypothetical protein
MADLLTPRRGLRGIQRVIAGADGTDPTVILRELQSESTQFKGRYDK